VSCASVKVCTAAFRTRRSSVPSLFCAPPLHLFAFKPKTERPISSKSTAVVRSNGPAAQPQKPLNFRLQFGKLCEIRYVHNRFVSFRVYEMPSAETWCTRSR
jgi:hypothetical protein